ncbi:MAG: hypothetical protein K9G70_00150 [Prolixibacteraceae bacterium]|nr:hypothetical protein [Prolixibacteraceae bacterium]
MNLKNIKQNGFIDIEVPANSTFENTINRNILFNERKVFLKYRIFDRYSKYDSFKIDTKNNTIKFNSKKAGANEYEFISETAWPYSELPSYNLTLIGTRLNGRDTTIKEKLSPPSINNLEMNQNNNNFYTTAFIYA